jgi:hypothetical protein
VCDGQSVSQSDVCMYVCMYGVRESMCVMVSQSVSQSDVCMYVWCEGEYVCDGLSVSQSDACMHECMYVCMVGGRVCV